MKNIEEKKRLAAPRRNHYVPKLLLKAFSKRKGKSFQTNVFDKSTGNSYTTSIDNVCLEKDYYRVKFDDGDASVEDAFTAIEDAAAPVIKGIRDASRLGHLTPNAKEKLLAFVSIQQGRGAGARARIQQIGDVMRARFERAGQDPESIAEMAFTLDPEKMKLPILTGVFKNLPNLVSLLREKKMLLFHTDESNLFWLGDEPVVMHNNNDLGPYGNIGLAVPGIEIYMPLSPNLVLGFWCRSIHTKIAARVSRYENLKTRTVLGSVQIAREAAADLAANKWDYQISRDIIRKIDSGDSLMTTRSNVEFFNSLQVQFAERSIVSKEMDFALAKAIIEKNQKHKSGARLDIS